MFPFIVKLQVWHDFLLYQPIPTWKITWGKYHLNTDNEHSDAIVHCAYTKYLKIQVRNGILKFLIAEINLFIQILILDEKIKFEVFSWVTQRIYLWGQFEGAGLGFSLASRRVKDILAAASSSLRKWHKDNGAGLLWEGTGRKTRDSNYTLLFGRMAIRKRGGGAALEQVAHCAMEIPFLGLLWFCVAKSQKPTVWWFS